MNHLRDIAFFVFAGLAVCHIASNAFEKDRYVANESILRAIACALLAIAFRPW